MMSSIIGVCAQAGQQSLGSVYSTAATQSSVLPAGHGVGAES